MRDLLRYLNVAGGKFQMEQNSVELERIQELLATLQEGRKVFRPREQEEVFPARGPQGQLLWASREELMAAQAAQGGVSDPSDPSDKEARRPGHERSAPFRLPRDRKRRRRAPVDRFQGSGKGRERRPPAPGFLGSPRVESPAGSAHRAKSPFKVRTL